MIENKVSLIHQLSNTIQYRMKNMGGGDISVKTSYEEGSGYAPLPLNIHVLEQIRDLIENIMRLRDEVGDLQRQKLRLLNDYDFTHGDKTDQKRVFGEK
jgi:hypothetical protein